MRRILALAAAALGAASLACATSAAQQPTARNVPPGSSVATEHPYEMRGTVESVGGGLFGMGRTITIQRERAPAVVLQVAEGTRVVVDGRVTNLSAIRAGDDVRATFDFDGTTPVAIELEAKQRR